MTRPVRTHTIDDVKYNVIIDEHYHEYVDIPHLRNCEGEIYIDPHQSPREVFECGVHAILHLCNPNWPEEVVLRAGKEVTRFMFNRLGYRRKENK